MLKTSVTDFMSPQSNDLTPTFFKWHFHIPDHFLYQIIDFNGTMIKLLSWIWISEFPSSRELRVKVHFFSCKVQWWKRSGNDPGPSFVCQANLKVCWGPYAVFQLDRSDFTRRIWSEKKNAANERARRNSGAWDAGLWLVGGISHVGVNRLANQSQDKDRNKPH